MPLPILLVLIRLGFAPLDLTPREDTPIFGDDIAAAMERAPVPIDLEILSLRDQLFTVAPGFEGGGRHFFARIEAPIGLGSQVRSYGVGVYPLGVAVPLRRGAVVPYVTAGGVASWLDRIDDDGEAGLLLEARLALGVRLRRVVLEVGHGAFVVGGVVDRTELGEMRGGEQRDRIDLSLGVAW